MYRRQGDGKLTTSEHPAARPYAWPVAHDVRPAVQSLGARSCADCHATDSPINFAIVAPQGPVDGKVSVAKAMYELRGDSGAVAWAFAASFVFRPLLKIVSFAAAAILLGVMAVARPKGLGSIFWDRIIYGAMLLGICGTAATSLIALIGWGGPMHGWLLMIHCTAAPLFAVAVAGVALAWADRCAFGRDGACSSAGKRIFWAIMLCAVVVILSAVTPMTPLLGTYGQEMLYHTHRYSSLLLLAMVIVQAWGFARSRR
jgi:hypothetical protein